MNYNFSILDKPQTEKQAQESKALKENVKQSNIHLERLKSFNSICKRPKPNEQYRIITQKKFNAHEAILQILQENTIDELYLGFYRICKSSVNLITELIKDGKIKKASFIVSHFYTNTKEPEKWVELLKQYVDNEDNCRIKDVDIHTKISLIKQGNDYFVFEGSGNISKTNSKIEQYIWENNEKVYNFHKTWMEEILNAKI
jgi:hypothetical protein